ncbi:MAG: GNAT family N-acetyltransferase [Nocardioides sp.]|jgi:GNAT superfamily N-acetyltransferase
MTAGELLAVYDEQLRTTAEVRSAQDVTRDGPLLRARFDRGGFVTYRDLGGLTGAELDNLIARTITHFETQSNLDDFEWKSRGHDAPPDLGERLIAAGLTPEEVETVMLGEAAGLVASQPPAGVTVRRVDQLPDRADVIGRAAALQAAIFGAGPTADEVLARLDRDPVHAQFWIAEAEGEIISAGRLELVPGTEVAGLWGGATHPDHRGRGVYRALTAARARATLDAGWRYLHSDSTAMSRPILERSGLVAITTTTPYVWTR